MPFVRSAFFIALFTTLLAGAASAQSPGAAEFFETKIRPVLAQHCFKCHSSELQIAGLNLSTAAGLLKGGESGPVVIPGEPENSRLVAVVSYQEKLKMPPTGKLPDEQIADLRSWVKMGASWPDSEAVATPAPASKPAGFTKEQREFWSFQPVAECVPPPVKNRGWISNPIDSFILSKLESKGLKPAPPADKWTLLRRATFDLTGLPPTTQEIEVHTMFKAQLASLRKRLDDAVATDLGNFNRMLREKNIGNVIATGQ